MKKLLETIKSWLNKTDHEHAVENPPAPDAPAPKEDDSELVGEILWEVLLEQGVRPSEIRNAKIKELFDAWYDGDRKTWIIHCRLTATLQDAG